MDTKEKNREAAGSRKPQAERPVRKAEAAKQPRKKKPVNPLQALTKRKRPAEQTRSRREAPAQPRQRREAPAQPGQRREASAESRQRREMPVEAQQPVQPRQQAGQPRQRQTPYSGTTVQRPQRSQSGQISAPQGTGPRKSAPQLSAEETAQLRRSQSSRSSGVKASEKKNALQNFIAGVKGDPTSDAAEKAEQRRKERAARAEKKRKQAERNDTPAVIYTQPLAFSRDRLLVQLLTVAAVVAAVILGMSVFFKVKTITVAGAETYSAWAISEASGISEGDSLLTFSKAKASAKIQASLSYVDDVRIGIKLPDTVIIYIEEMDVSYAIESTQGDWWLINSGGRVVEQITSAAAKNHTQVLGVMLEEPQVGNTAVAANEIPQETLASGEFVPLSVTGEQRLSSALQILKALEANDIVGQAASVDVTDLEDIMLWYGSQYEVMLGDSSRMEYKIACMNDAILELSEYQSGILDISFDYKTDQVVYTPFG